jgi:glycine dehydrogenase
MASFYAVFHGPKGLRAIAERVHSKTARLARGWRRRVRARSRRLFDTITVPVGPAGADHGRGRARGASTCATWADRIGITVDETTTPDLEAVCRAFGILKPPGVLPAADPGRADADVTIT